jgi:AraC-like DNA-binding protein
MPVWEVSRLPEREQFDYWREVICQAFVPLTPGRKTGAPGFASTVETRPLAGVNRARIASRAQTTRHGPREVAATDGAYYFVNLHLAGRCRVAAEGSDAVVRPGQFVVLDTTRPYHLDFDADWRMLSYRIPHAALHGGAGAGLRLGAPIDGSGVGGVVTSLMRALWRVDDAVGPAALHDLQHAFTAAVQAVVGQAPGDGGAPPRETLRTAVLQHVGERLADPSLSVSSVCRALAISPRTLHNLFAGEEQTFAATVRRLRLERSAAVLADPGCTATVADVAAAHGFADPTTFARAFRRRYGCAPRDVRGGTPA